MEVIRKSSLLKEAKLDYYKRYSEYVNVKCPFCANKMSRTRTYHSLKSLTWHIANEHDSDSGYPFSFEKVDEVVRALALAKEWRILPYQECSQSNCSPTFPRVRRYLD